MILWNIFIVCFKFHVICLMKRKMPKSIRKYVRKEKARIRRRALSSREQEELISRLYQKIPRTRNSVSVGGQSGTELSSGAGLKQNEDKRDLQPGNK